MAQVEGYDSRLATELEKWWREKILAGAAQDFRDAIARELAPIKTLVGEASQAQSGRLDQLDRRIGKLEEIDQKLNGLIEQIEGGTREFSTASQQMSAIPGIVAATTGLTDKIGKIDSYLENFDRRANQSNNLNEISKIIDAPDLDPVHKVGRIRTLLGKLQATRKPLAGHLRFRNAKIVLAALIITFLLVVAALAASGLIPINWPAEKTPSAEEPVKPRKSDKQLVRDGWMILKAQSPEMAKRVEQNCAQSECDIVQIVASDLTKKPKASLADEIFKVGPAYDGPEAPSCDYNSNDEILAAARSGAAPPNAIHACLSAALATEKDAAAPLNVRDYGAFIKAYLVAIGRAGDPPPGATEPAQGGSSTSNGNGGATA